MDATTKVAGTETTFGDLLVAAVNEPGTISSAYRAFHNYSLGNQLLAFGQCMQRGIPLGPLASFNRWKERGRHVSKGSKAIELCMPIAMRRKLDTPAPDGSTEATFTRFTFKRNWFVLAQTEGQDYVPEPTPGWDARRAMAALDVTEVPFSLMDGNCQGYAMARNVAVSAIAIHPVKTLVHEIAHVVLGHTAEHTMEDSDRTPRDIREVEAEGVAMLVTAALGLPGMEDSRGYIQHWYGAGNPIPEASARKILKTADTILKAGAPAVEATTEAQA